MIHARSSLLQQRRYSVYRVLSQHIPTNTIVEAYRTPHHSIAAEQLHETKKNLRTCPGHRSWHHWLDIIYVLDPSDVVDEVTA